MSPRAPSTIRKTAAVAAAVLLASVLLLVAPLLVHGPLPVGSDVYAVSHYLQGFMKAFGEGDLYPRWTDRTNQALGAPSFVLFPPLIFYGAGAASWLAGSIIGGLKLYLIVVAVLTGLSFYALAREWIGGGVPAALAAGIYLLLPYHVLDMYQRFAVPETTSFIFFPLILLFLRRVVRSGRPIDVVGLAACYAGLICTHLVSAFLFSLLLGPWIVFESRGRFRPMIRAGAALVCGMAIAAPALLPAALEKSQVNIAWVREMAHGDFRINFIFKDDLIPGLAIRDPVKPPVLRSAHSQLALAAVAAALAMAWTPKRDQRRRAEIAAMAAACGVAYLLQLEISTPLWRLVPELPTVQFPWRFQTIMVLATAVLCGHAFSAGWERRTPGSRPARRPAVAAVLLLLAALFTNLAFSAQNAFLKPFAYDRPHAENPFVMHWSDPSTTPVAFESYRQLKSMRIELPVAAFSEGSGEARVVLWHSSRREVDVASASGGVVVLRSFWFPGWTGALDGQPLALQPTPRMGLTSFRVPAGDHRVTLRFEATPVRRLSWPLSLAGVLAAAGVGIAGRRARSLEGT